MAKTYGDVVASICYGLYVGAFIAYRRLNGELAFATPETATTDQWRNQIDSAAAISELTVSNVMHDDVYVN